MDEPLAALDTQIKTEIIQFIRKIEKELSIPIIYVTHSMSEVLQLVDTMVILKDGKVVKCGPVEKVFSDIQLRDAIGDQHSGAILDTTVLEHDTEFGITRVDFMGQALSVPLQSIPQGQGLRVHIHSKDVSLATQAPEGLTSVLNILKTKEFVVNFVTKKMSEKMNLTAIDAPENIDEFIFSKIKKIKSKKVKVPSVKDSPINLECKFLQKIDLKSTTKNKYDNKLIIGEIIGIRIDDNFIKNGRVDSVAMKLLGRLGYTEYTTISSKFKMKRPHWHSIK